MSITRRLAGSIADYQNPDSVGSRLRARRIGPLLRMIDEAHARHGEVRIIDIGGTETYWRIVSTDFLASRMVQITVVNLPGEPRPADHGPFRFLGADGCRLDAIADKAFHIAHSNSVLEHVGDWSRMQAFASEVARVAERFFVQTPNYWFPVEPHCMVPFFHWLPRPTRLWLVLRFQLGHWPRAADVSDGVAIVESARLLDRRMMRALFPGADVLTERLLWLPKSFVAVSR
jgi:hypothetical protein